MRTKAVHKEFLAVRPGQKKLVLSRARLPVEAAVGEGENKCITQVVRTKRSWKTDTGYESSGSFCPQDLLALGEAPRDCYLWITAEEAKQNKNGGSNGGAEGEPF